MNNNNTILRITALWAFSESVLGGILHGFKLPFAGLILACFAATCMGVIALFQTEKSTLFKSCLVVIVIKFILSPHTPPTAYIAVFIECALAYIFLLFKPAIAITIVPLTLLCLLYSAFHKLIVLTVVMGNAFWESINIFFTSIIGKLPANNFSYVQMVIAVYMGVYIVMGVIGGIINRKIIISLQKPNSAYFLNVNTADSSSSAILPISKKRSNKSIWIGIVFFLLLVVSYFFNFKNTFLYSKVAEVIVRTVLVVLTWRFIFLPVLKICLEKLMKHIQQKQQTQIQAVINLFPHIKQIVIASWHKTKGTSYKRLYLFMQYTFINLLYA
jgi:hypothetical protein